MVCGGYLLARRRSGGVEERASASARGELCRVFAYILLCCILFCSEGSSGCRELVLRLCFEVREGVAREGRSAGFCYNGYVAVRAWQARSKVKATT
jgi:hypothetical protein